MNFRGFILAISVSFIALSCGISAALADGMPFGTAKPKPPELKTPLDAALDEVEATAPPVNVMPPAEAAAPAVPEPALAKDEIPPVPEQRAVEQSADSSFLGLSIGMYDVFSHGQKAGYASFEWQPDLKLGMLQPMLGAMVTTDRAMFGYVGLGLPIDLAENVVMTPSFAVGGYDGGRGGFDLGRSIAYRLGGEIAYKFEDNSRFGLSAFILTNGRSFERSDRTEMIGLNYTIPLKVASAEPVPLTPQESASPAENAAPAAEETQAQ